MSRTVWTIIGVIAAIVIAWFLVDVVFSVLWFIVKVVIVAVVAVVVYFVLQSVFGRSRDERSIEQ